MKKIELIKEDLCKLQVDAIVNAANPTLLGGGGVDGAIHKAAGPELLKACIPLQGCHPGEAKITEGYRLPSHYVIHTVGPVWQGGNQHEPELLASCYERSLRIAAEMGLRTIAFPNISTGVYGYPKPEAAQIAIRTAQTFLTTDQVIEKVFFCCFDQENFRLYQTILSNAIEIVPVSTNSDIEQIVRLAKEIWTEHYLPIIGQDQIDYMLNKYQSIEAIRHQISQEEFSYFLFANQGGPCGYLAYQVRGSNLFLSKIYVLKSKRGKGIAKQGIDFLIDIGKAKGLKAITLTVNKHNTNTIQAYSKLGFIITGAVVTEIGSGYVMDDYQMELSL